MSKAEKTRKLLDELDCQACGRMLEIQTKGICAPSCGSEYRLNDEIELELEELESKAAKWDDPQTQANLELAAAIKELSESEATIYFEINGEMIGFPGISDFISWHKDQKGGQDD